MNFPFFSISFSTAPEDCFLYQLANGMTDVISGMEGAKLRFTCNIGYMFDGGMVGDIVEITCLSNGTLERDIPSCSSKF